MRFPTKGDDFFTNEVNHAFENLREIHLDSIKPTLVLKKVNVMLGDGTITQAETFEPQKVIALYQQLINSLGDWNTTGISKSSTDDLHRIYCQFAKFFGKYHITAYFGIQFHLLPYYVVDKRIIEIQKELTSIAENATRTWRLISSRGNNIIKKELEIVGIAEMEPDMLFSELFDNMKLATSLESKAIEIENEFPEFKDMKKRKDQLFAELNQLLTELYQISPVSIDYNRLMQGEEGVTTYLDIEMIKNKKTKERESFLNTKAMAEESTRMIVRNIVQLQEKLELVSNQSQVQT
jgi:hypothetical protein